MKGALTPKRQVRDLSRRGTNDDMLIFVSMLTAYTPTPLPMRGQHYYAQPRLAVRAAGTMLNEQPYRSDEQFDYFRRTKEETFTLAQPIGAVIESGSAGGVVVADFADAESAGGALKKNDVIVSVMGNDVSEASVDDVTQLLTSSPAEVTLGIKRNVVTRKPRLGAAPPKPATAPAQEFDSKLDKKFDQNFGTAEKTAKTLSKVAKITTAKATWKNPIYFWSVAGTALIFVPILLYAANN